MEVLFGTVFIMEKTALGVTSYSVVGYSVLHVLVILEVPTYPTPQGHSSYVSLSKHAHINLPSITGKDRLLAFPSKLKSFISLSGSSYC